MSWSFGYGERVVGGTVKFVVRVRVDEVAVVLGVIFRALGLRSVLVLLVV